ncbi:hypothetical protein ACFSTD_13570 [Novosphingobium colocasiae]
MRVLSLSTLFPNPVKPSFGVFVGNQMRAVTARGEVDLTMVSPLGIPPWPLSRREPYARLKDLPPGQRCRRAPRPLSAIHGDPPALAVTAIPGASPMRCCRWCAAFTPSSRSTWSMRSSSSPMAPPPPSSRGNSACR